MLVGNSDHADNRGLDRFARAHGCAGASPCLVASSDAQIQQEQQSEQQQQEQQQRLAQHSLAMGDHRGKT